MAQVGIIKGCQSDLSVMKEAIEILKALGIEIEVANLLSEGKIVKSGESDLALYVEKHGYSEFLA